MAYDKGLYTRLAEALSGQPVAELKMMGGVGFTVNGHIACGVFRDSLIVRVGPERYYGALSHDHVREFNITGKSMKGWVMVAPEGVSEDTALASWVRAGVNFAQTLPPK